MKKKFEEKIAISEKKLWLIFFSITFFLRNAKNDKICQHLFFVIKRTAQLFQQIFIW